MKGCVPTWNPETCITRCLRLNERTLSDGPLESLRKLIRDSFKDLDLRAPRGELAREVLDRAWASLNALLKGGYQLPLAVTHGNR